MKFQVRQALSHRGCKPVVWLLCLWPSLWLLGGIACNTLGANPAEFVIRATGDWTLRFLCLTLAVTPLRVLLKIPELAQLRRMLGLYTYFYAVLHVLCYSALDMGFEWTEMALDVIKRPFIGVGVMGWIVLTILAMTSSRRAVRWLGAKRWQSVHRWVYGVAVLAVLHFFWMRAGKQNFAEVWMYASVLAGLLLFRLCRFWAMQPKTT